MRHVGLLCGLLLPAVASAQAPSQDVTAVPAARSLGVVWLLVDADDDDGNGVADRAQTDGIPAEDLLSLSEKVLGNARRISIRGDAARLVRGGRAIGKRTVVTPDSAGDLNLQGIKPGTARLHVEGPNPSAPGSVRTVDLRVARLSVLDATNTRIDPAVGALQVSLQVTNDDSLPSGAAFGATSRDPRNLRIELVAPTRQGRADSIHLQSFDLAERPRDAVTVNITRPQPGGTFRSPFLRLVSDAMDARAPGVSGRVLQVGLRDRIRTTWQSPTGPLHQDIAVGRPGHEGGPTGALRGRLRVVVMQSYAGGPPVIGRGVLSALRIARAQVRTANETWAQCGITFGPASEADITMSPPPPPSLASISDGDGLPARGAGVMQLRVNGQPIGPIATRAGARPIDTAMDLARVIRTAGFFVRVTENPRAQFGVHGSADLLVRGRSGELATLAPMDGLPLSTDRRQSLSIGVVDLSDGLSEFDNMNARAGTLEERSLVKALSDEDPATIDVFIVDRFASGTRQGEAFIEASQGAIINTLIIDRNGLMQRDTAWTLGHELGHVLLDEPLHPDNLGPDRPWLLMDSDSNRGTVYGPKRLSSDECKQARFESGPDASPALLLPAP